MTYYGTSEYYDKVYELEDRGFNENYNPNFWEESYLDRVLREEREKELDMKYYEELEDEEDDEEYERG